MVTDQFWVMFSWLMIRAIVFGRAFRRCFAMSTQTREEEQPIPDRLYVNTSGLILKRFTIMAAMLGVGAKQLHDTITIPICKARRTCLDISCRLLMSQLCAHCSKVCGSWLSPSSLTSLRLVDLKLAHTFKCPNARLVQLHVQFGRRVSTHLTGLDTRLLQQLLCDIVDDLLSLI